jgi:hypothetical protein
LNNVTTRHLSLVALLVLIPAIVGAQFWSSRVHREPSMPYDGRWVFTRIRYGPSSSWNHDYPRADRHLQHIIAELSTANTRTDGSNVFDLDDPEIFQHPLIYMSEPGFWDMSDSQADALRKYLLKGGFILFDDFETTQWNNMAAQMRRVVPEYRWIEIDVTHPIFHSFFEMKRIDYHHPMYPGMEPGFHALFEGNDPAGRMLALANHNNDLAEYWEWSGTGMFPIISTNEAYKIGVNYVIYAFTH